MSVHRDEVCVVIFERTILEALSPDPLEEARSRVQTRRIAEVIRQRQAMVHAALKESVVPTERDEAGVVA